MGRDVARRVWARAWRATTTVPVTTHLAAATHHRRRGLGLKDVLAASTTQTCANVLDVGTSFTNDRHARGFASSSSSSSVSSSDALFPGATATSTVAESESTLPRQTSFESGRLARLTDGAVLIRSGETVALCAATASREIDQGSAIKGFAPLLVDYRERSYAKGKIPNTFTLREGPPKEREILAMLVINKATLPLFPKEFAKHTQFSFVVMASYCVENPAILCVNETNASLTSSIIP